MLEPKSKPTVAALLNVYMRGEHLEKQIGALLEQSVPPDRIYIWQNGDHFEIPEHILKMAVVSRCNENLGVWARLAFALNIREDYICMLDDDTIPGDKWIQNCLSTLKTHQGLLGTRGLRFKSPASYRWADEFGWNSPNEEIVQVDIVGHAWFFKRELLQAFWSEAPSEPFTPTAGEDIHFSFAIQKHLGLNTYVPPHPENDMTLWGSTPIYARTIGTSKAAISKQPESLGKFQKAYLSYIKRGFKLSNEGTDDRTLKEKFKDDVEDAGLGLVIRNSRIYRKLKKGHR